MTRGVVTTSILFYFRNYVLPTTFGGYLILNDLHLVIRIDICIPISINILSFLLLDNIIIVYRYNYN